MCLFVRRSFSVTQGIKGLRISKYNFRGVSLLKTDSIGVCGLAPRCAAFLRLHLKCQLCIAKASERIFTGNISY